MNNKRSKKYLPSMLVFADVFDCVIKTSLFLLFCTFSVQFIFLKIFLHLSVILSEYVMTLINIFFPESICEYFGVKIAMYFAWLGHYTTALCIPAIVGIFFWVIPLRLHACMLWPTILWENIIKNYSELVLLLNILIGPNHNNQIESNTFKS